MIRVVEDVGEYGIEDAPQEFSSAKTSINTKRTPSIFKLVKFETGTVNLDYGGGVSDIATEKLAAQGVTNMIYDKYNRSSEHNKKVIAEIKGMGGADTVTCSNVLNVIKEYYARMTVIKNCRILLKPSGTAYFTVYEGQKGQEEGPTSKGYQLAKPVESYMDEIGKVFSNVKRKGSLIIAK